MGRWETVCNEKELLNIPIPGIHSGGSIDVQLHQNTMQILQRLIALVDHFLTNCITILKASFACNMKCYWMSNITNFLSNLHNQLFLIRGK